jgi:hypothetical protein
MGENIDAYRSGQVAMQMNLRLSGLVLKRTKMWAVAIPGYFPTLLVQQVSCTTWWARHLGRCLF